MKFKFWKKNNENLVENNNDENRVVDRSDDSTVYDYDKIAHNQFLTDDHKQGRYFTNTNDSLNRTKSYENLKKMHMTQDEMAFNSVNRDINANLKMANNDYKNLYSHSKIIKENHQIPIKKRSSLFKKDNNSYQYHNIEENINDYNIVENRTKKYDNVVNYNTLKNEQTKLLDLNEFEEEPLLKTKPLEFTNKTNATFSINNHGHENLTNRLFEDAPVANASHLNDNKNNFIPRKTIKLSFANENQNITSLNNAKEMVNNPNNNYSNNSNFNLNNAQNVVQNNQNSKLVNTTALRYLTPVDEDDEIDNHLRIKKENRRFIKYRD